MRFLPLALICLTAACQPTGPDAPAPTIAASGACGADGYAGLVGNNIAAVTLPDEVWFRVIYPDMAVTQDYAEDRLNFDVDSAGVIQRAYCG